MGSNITLEMYMYMSVSIEDFEILDGARNQKLLLTLEALYIRQQKPSLNTKDEFRSWSLSYVFWGQEPPASHDSHISYISSSIPVVQRSFLIEKLEHFNVQKFVGYVKWMHWWWSEVIGKLWLNILFLIFSNFKAQGTQPLRLLMWELDRHGQKKLFYGYRRSYVQLQSNIQSVVSVWMCWEKSYTEVSEVSHSK